MNSWMVKIRPEMKKRRELILTAIKAEPIAKPHRHPRDFRTQAPEDALYPLSRSVVEDIAWLGAWRIGRVGRW